MSEVSNAKVAEALAYARKRKNAKAPSITNWECQVCDWRQSLPYTRGGFDEAQMHGNRTHHTIFAIHEYENGDIEVMSRMCWELSS